MDPKQIIFGQADSKFIDPISPIMEELKRLDNTIHSIAHQIRFALEAMSNALEVMEIRLQKLEKNNG